MASNHNDTFVHGASEPLLNSRSSGMHPMARAVSSEQLASLQGGRYFNLLQALESGLANYLKHISNGRPREPATVSLQTRLTSGGAGMQAKSSPCRAQSR